MSSPFVRQALAGLSVRRKVPEGGGAGDRASRRRVEASESEGVLRRAAEGESTPIDELKASGCTRSAEGASQNDESRLNSSATVGSILAGIQRYSMDGNPLT